MLSESNKRIAKNTLFLYLRMFVSIIVNLYTVKVVWQVLGVDNYGIYNIVGGIVLMFQFLNSAMVASSQRFISFELGRGENGDTKKAFAVSITVHFILAFIIFLLAETIGLWFLNEKLNIPAGRMVAANWVFQASILSFMTYVVSVPYNAVIVAREHMKIYGYFSILEVVLRLLIVYALMILPFDKLIAYSLLALSVSIIMRILYGFYCSKHFSECHYKFEKDMNMIKSMFSFAGWSFIGNMGFAVRDQGLNFTLNMFFNVAMNAAKGVANQVTSVIQGFTGSFQMAVNPQITKLYAAGNIEEMTKLIRYSSKYSFLLLSFIAIPFFFKCEYVLQLWLGNISENIIVFTRLALIMMLIDSMVSPITTAMQATGDIKKFQIVISIIMIANLPVAYLWLRLDLNPYIVSYVAIATSTIALFARLMLLNQLIKFDLRRFLFDVIGRVSALSLIVFPIAYSINKIIPQTFIGLILYCIIILLCTVALSYIITLNKSERAFCVSQINKVYKRLTTYA